MKSQVVNKNDSCVYAYIINLYGNALFDLWQLQCTILLIYDSCNVQFYISEKW